MKFDPHPCCHVSEALRDVCVELLAHRRAGTTPNAGELEHWQDCISRASTAHGNLVVACENIVELGSSEERIAAMKAVLARAQGTESYTPRQDRW